METPLTTGGDKGLDGVSKPPANPLIIGASQGIGLGFVTHLLGQGTGGRVYATYRNAETAQALFELEKNYGDRLVCLPLDVTEEAQIITLTETLKREIGQLHWVINCVGVLHDKTLQPEKNLRQLNAEQLLRSFQVNSIAPVLVAKHLLPLLRQGDRSILATLSARLGSIGENQLGGWYGYRASKAALNMFMRTAAIEYRRSAPNAIVVVLHPGTTNTRLSRPFQTNVPPEKLFSVDRTVTQLLAVLQGLTSEDSGQFFSWDGTRLPW